MAGIIVIVLVATLNIAACVSMYNQSTTWIIWKGLGDGISLGYICINLFL